MRYRVGMLGVTAGLLCCSAAWYLRPIFNARRIGITWRVAMLQAHCSRGRFGEYCTTNWPVHPDPVRGTRLNIEPWTRTLSRADRSWSLPDSAAWVRVLDSTRRALASRGWDQLPCDTTITHFPIAEAWHVGNQEVQLYAAPVSKLFNGETRALLNVQLLPYGSGSCGPRYGRRLLTPDEVAQRIRAWVSEQLGLW